MLVCKEKWVPVSGYEGLYEVSNLGNVRSLPRIVVGRNGVVPGKPIVRTRQKTGYYRVCLCANNTKKFMLVHRLVAEAFIPNTNSYEFVNHKDENRGNNIASNLEWCTAKYNQNYGTAPLKKRLKRIETHGRPIFCIDKDGHIVKEYICITDVWKDGFERRNVNAVLKGRRKTCGGYFWKYKDCEYGREKEIGG